jgi:hypothetical protein
MFCTGVCLLPFISYISIITLHNRLCKTKIYALGILLYINATFPLHYTYMYILSDKHKRIKRSTVHLCIYHDVNYINITKYIIYKKKKRNIPTYVFKSFL